MLCDSNKMKKNVSACARFKGDIKWLLPHAEYAKVYVYNKGEPITNVKHENISIIDVPNVGLDGFCHLTHIINHYDEDS